MTEKRSSDAAISASLLHPCFIHIMPYLEATGPIPPLMAQQITWWGSGCWWYATKLCSPMGHQTCAILQYSHVIFHLAEWPNGPAVSKLHL